MENFWKKIPKLEQKKARRIYLPTNEEIVTPFFFSNIFCVKKKCLLIYMKKKDIREKCEQRIEANNTQQRKFT